ncbi:MAG: hypothetical protein B6A08_01355 [Sorangiineae bacterium NIC37A_2]|jgi:dihydrofolate reductase|nr:MAG: hypothetical protein B6A08_01355 [Sorangiineae bacterium NIC37A_2]
MLVSLIAAVAQNGVIGRDNQLPFRLADDMRHFVRTTRGHTVISGRLNFDAMGRALPGRTNLVVSRDPSYARPDAVTVPSLEDALHRAKAGGETEAFVIGGGQIYALALPYADRFYRTRVLADVPGDVFFPEFDESEFELEVLSEHERDEKNEHPFRIELLTRRGPARPLSSSQ